MSLDSMQILLHQNYGIEASRIQLYREKRKALEVIEGNHSHSYPLLTTYASEVRKSNPGSLVKMQCDRMSINHNPVFKRFFISFEALGTGFMTGCRPFIGIDGCHLKGPYGGVLLAATALDGNNGLFPIAVGVVESEGRDSWTFFIDHLHTVIGAGNQSRAWTFMSDHQKSLDRVIAEMIPEATHRTCARHLFSNFRKKHPGLLLKRYFWQAARAYNALEFGYAMDSIKGISEEAHKWLSEVPTVWSKHAFNENGIRTKLMTRLQKRYERALHWPGIVGPNVRKRLHKAQVQGRQSTLMHAAAAITHKRANLEDYCDLYFHKDYYLKAHGGIIHPVSDQSRWEHVGGDIVEPPPLRRLPGRPRKCRRRDVDEAEAGTSQSRRSQIVKCSICKDFGHNKREKEDQEAEEEEDQEAEEEGGQALELSY
ncbi:hypothetical protein Vadar_002763 [Vaccinium darrowii]|uniref:Uncharacterized protein n=1 Tax=Vaccinium darrowii TaxID=229202 RepID=A0ACB7ZGT6_9ERIC|nr:hypothetical protein Vadar_002763 [Vaccinium darrowii]